MDQWCLVVSVTDLEAQRKGGSKLAMTASKTTVAYSFSRERWHETRNFRSGGHRRIGRDGAGIARRECNGHRSTGNIAEFPWKLGAGASIGPSYSAGESRCSADRAGGRAVDRNQNLSAANRAGNCEGVAGLRGSVAERSGSHRGAANSIWKRPRGPGNNRSRSREARFGTIHPALAVRSLQPRHQRRAFIGSHHSTVERSWIYLPVHSERADFAVGQAMFPGTVGASVICIRYERRRVFCGRSVETEAEPGARRDMCRGEGKRCAG